MPLSGAQWVALYPTSISLSDLQPDFRTSLNNFLAALTAAGAGCTIAATLRPPERAYLMHWSYRIARENHDPRQVPAMAGVSIDWVHTRSNGSYDETASRSAAIAMTTSYGTVYRPSLTSRHTEGRAVDMNISWSGTLRIRNAQGRRFPSTRRRAPAPIPIFMKWEPAMASSNSSAIRRIGPMMVTERMCRAVVMAVLATLGGIAQADTLPIVGVLAPSENGPVLHGLVGWRSNGEPLRYLDQSGHALCCIHIAPIPIAGASALMRDGEAGGDLYAAELSDALAARAKHKPLLGPVLDTHTTGEKQSSTSVTLRQGDHRSRLSRCTTSEGVRFTVEDAGTSAAIRLYLPLGYDLTPSCK